MLSPRAARIKGVELEMTARPARPFASRVRNAITFVAIVWSVATTFVIFDVLSLSGMDLALSFPALFGNIALSRTVTQSISCAVGPGEQPELRSPANGPMPSSAPQPMKF